MAVYANVVEVLEVSDVSGTVEQWSWMMCCQAPGNGFKLMMMKMDEEVTKQ